MWSRIKIRFSVVGPLIAGRDCPPSCPDCGKTTDMALRPLEGSEVWVKVAPDVCGGCGAIVAIRSN